MVVFIAMAAVWAQNARSETALLVGAWSMHPFSERDYTSSHDLYGIEHKNWMVARYRNSHGRESYAVGYGKAWQYGDVRLSGYVGATTGYTVCWRDDDSGNNLCPMAFGAMHYTRYRVQPGVILFGEALAVTVRVAL